MYSDVSRRAEDVHGWMLATSLTPRIYFDINSTSWFPVETARKALVSLPRLSGLPPNASCGFPQKVRDVLDLVTMRGEKLVELAKLCLIEMVLDEDADLTLNLSFRHTAVPLAVL